MSTTTQCPVCGTRFKATQAQLEAYQGMVRCGNCNAAFNAVEHRTSVEPSPQLDLPIMVEGANETEPEDEKEAIKPVTAARKPVTQPESAEAGKNEDSGDKLTSTGELSLFAKKEKPRAGWHWLAASVLLLLLLLGQGIYMFRVDLAAKLPGLKPTLVSACAELGCTVPLPRNIDLMDIESSNLETNPAHPGIITLDVTLRNLARYAQAYPNIELTLTDFNEVPVGRRVISPSEYLKAQQAATAGLEGKRTHNIQLAMDASALKPVGYKLFLFY